MKIIEVTDLVTHSRPKVFRGNITKYLKLDDREFHCIYWFKKKEGNSAISIEVVDEIELLQSKVKKLRSENHKLTNKLDNSVQPSIVGTLEPTTDNSLIDFLSSLGTVSKLSVEFEKEG